MLLVLVPADAHAADVVQLGPNVWVLIGTTVVSGLVGIGISQLFKRADKPEQPAKEPVTWHAELHPRLIQLEGGLQRVRESQTADKSQFDSRITRLHQKVTGMATSAEVQRLEDEVRTLQGKMGELSEQNTEQRHRLISLERVIELRFKGFDGKLDTMLQMMGGEKL